MAKIRVGVWKTKHRGSRNGRYEVPPAAGMHNGLFHGPPSPMALVSSYPAIIHAHLTISGGF